MKRGDEIDLDCNPHGQYTSLIDNQEIIILRPAYYGDGSDEARDAVHNKKNNTRDQEIPEWRIAKHRNHIGRHPH